MYIPINIPQGGGSDISSFFSKKAWAHKETFLKFRQSQPFDSPAQMLGFAQG